MIQANFLHSLLKSILIFGSYKYLGVVVQFLASMLITRLLMPEELGIVALITVFSGFLMMFSENGMSFIIIRSNYGLTFWNAISALLIRIGFFLFTIMIILVYPISLFYNNPKLIPLTSVISLLFIIQPYGMVAMAVLNKEQKFKILGKITFFTTIILAVTTIFLAYLNFSYWAIVIGTIVSKFTSVLLAIHYSKFRPFYGKIKHVKAAWGISKTLIFNLSGFTFINYWARNLDNLLIGKIYGVGDLGIYSKAYSLLMMPLGLIQETINKTIFPLLKKEKDLKRDYRVSFINSLKILGICLMPIVCLFVFKSNTLIQFIWGANWIQVAEILPYFGILIFIQPLIGLTGNLILLEEHDNKIFYNGLSVLFSVAGIIYGSFDSIVGIAKYYSLSNIVGTISFTSYYAYFKILKYPISFLLKFWAPKILFCLILWFGVSSDTNSIKITGFLLLFSHLLFSLRIGIYFFIKKLFIPSN